MSDHAQIYLKSSMQLAQVLQCLKQALRYSGPEPHQDSRGFHYFQFDGFRMLVGPNLISREPDALPEEWYPPFDSYPIEIEFLGRGTEEEEYAAARDVFEVLKTTNLWSMALTSDVYRVLDRYYPPTEEGRKTAEVDKSEAGIKALPRHDRAIYLNAAVSLDDMASILEKMLGGKQQRSRIIDNLTREVSIFVDFEGTGISLGVNDDPKTLSTYRFRITASNLRGQVVELEEARALFARLKAEARWPLLLVEDGKKILDRYDPDK